MEAQSRDNPTAICSSSNQPSNFPKTLGLPAAPADTQSGLILCTPWQHSAGFGPAQYHGCSTGCAQRAHVHLLNTQKNAELPLQKGSAAAHHPLPLHELHQPTACHLSYRLRRGKERALSKQIHTVV